MADAEEIMCEFVDVCYDISVEKNLQMFNEYENCEIEVTDDINFDELIDLGEDGQVPTPSIRFVNDNEACILSATDVP